MDSEMATTMRFGQHAVSDVKVVTNGSIINDLNLDKATEFVLRTISTACSAPKDVTLGMSLLGCHSIVMGRVHNLIDVDPVCGSPHYLKVSERLLDPVPKHMRE